MSEHIRIKKGLDIPLTGEAQLYVAKRVTTGTMAFRTSDFRGLKAKAEVAEGDRVITGQPLFSDIRRPRVIFCSPACGEVTSVTRKEDGSVEEVRIVSDASKEHVSFEVRKPSAMDRSAIVDLLLKGGLWPCIRQRPFGIIADPERMPNSIFVSAFSSVPLAPDYDFALAGQLDDLQTGIDVLGRLTRGGIHLCLPVRNFAGTDFHKLKGVIQHSVYGPHPAGNVGVQINRISPINKGEVIWTVNLQHVAAIGRFFTNGYYDMRRLVAMTGPAALNPSYVECAPGMCLSDIEDHFDHWQGTLRIISGDVLTGSNVGREGFLRFYDDMITILQEGEGRESFGWIKPLRFNKFSFSHLYPAHLLGPHKFEMDTLVNGSVRAFVMNDIYGKVFPMDIYPVELFKAILAGDREKMEQLGIYEVVEEDVALCEYVCPSKIEIQEIVSKGIDLMMEEE
ncbi:MAG: Na(+)-translocating NADH-quinone reductase subunit A [Bacteroidales bacterium]|nr:Na(+)-translocating NADH-quinone reductase subunit A [Bacteroidales bacterium]